MSIERKIAAGGELSVRLRDLIDAGRIGAARTMLNAVLRLYPGSEQIADLEARVLLREGKPAEACVVLDDAVARTPSSAALRLLRATAREQAGETLGALRDAAEAVVLAPAAVHGKAVLGALLSQFGRHAEARACLEEAVAKAPGDAGYRQMLAAAQSAGGDDAAALATLEAAITQAPAEVGLRTSAILLCMRLGDFAGAEALALESCHDGIADACVFGLLGHARSSLGRHAEAAQAYAEARKLAPEDPYVSHLAAAGGLAPDAGRASVDYVRIVFDGYAGRFDEHLLRLGYRVPGLLRIELAKLAPPGSKRLGPVLDLGCGTGLVAVAAADLALGPWVGVDLSSGMLREAGKRGLYAELHEADIEQFLAEDGRAFALILAGDCLPYFGDLHAVLRGLAARLAPGGQCLFSVERSADGGADARPWQLGRLGRYAHTEAYVEAAAAAAGLAVVRQAAETVRLEIGLPVRGLLVTLEGAAA